MTVFGDKALKEVNKLSEVVIVGSNTIHLESLYEKIRLYRKKHIKEKRSYEDIT